MTNQYFINSSALRELCIENNYCDSMDNKTYNMVLDNTLYDDFHEIEIHIRWVTQQIIIQSSRFKFNDLDAEEVAEIRAGIFKQIFESCLRVKVNI